MYIPWLRFSHKMDIFIHFKAFSVQFRGLVINPATDDDAIAKQVIHSALHFVPYPNKIYRKPQRRSQFQRSS